MRDPFDTTDLWKSVWLLIKWGALIWVGAWAFLACTGQLPSDPG
jgi:hypothetical protein